MRSQPLVSCRGDGFLSCCLAGMGLTHESLGNQPEGVCTRLEGVEKVQLNFRNRATSIFRSASTDLWGNERSMRIMNILPRTLRMTLISRAFSFLIKINLLK